MRLLLLIAALGLASPAAAQRPVSTVMELGGRPLALSPPEMARLSDLGRARTMSRGFQARALAAAERVVRTADGRYVLALYQLELSAQWRDDALRRRALDTLIATPGVPPAKLADYLAMRGGAAFRAGDHAASAADLGRVLELRPGDAQTMMNLAQARQGLGDGAGAIDLIRRAIGARRESGPIPESWYRQWLSIAFNGRLREQGTAAALGLIEAYPTPDNWRHALSVYRQLAEPQSGAEIALLRLMGVAGALRRPEEFQRLAQLLLQAGSPADARATLEDGIARGIVARDQSPTPDILRAIARGVGGRPALRPDVSGLREAAAHAAAGRRTEAAAAFRPIAAGGQGREAEIARFWLLWLARVA